ncbi:fumarylacetoacetate hydrolase family protein [Silvibacterium sp.]|uniref:fumarylacetoacetate hydrolase family protein n=1 Tax=Silvibacterium sp. TaxID=1964179 RepID=UPI0039E3E042
MKFVTYEGTAGASRVGVLSEGSVYELAGFANMQAVIAEPAKAEATAKTTIAGGNGTPEAQAKVLAPIARPPRIFCIGLNYASHADESQMKVQAVPTVFMKLASSVTGPDTDVILPYNSTQPDYEAELAVVIAKPGYRVKAADWQEYVFGYTIVNDISARDIQLATTQWTLGKSFPTFTPLGPAIVTKDEIADPHALDISLTVDGETLQSSNTKHLIFKIPQLIEYISSLTPLEAGDIISTGTPEGVGLGRTPQRWLRDNEEMVIRIEGVGELRNKTRAEKQA